VIRGNRVVIGIAPNGPGCSATIWVTKTIRIVAAHRETCRIEAERLDAPGVDPAGQ